MHSSVQLDIALVHYPVHNKKGAIIASAVTNLDLHDLARLAKTYELGAFHVITPVKAQQALIRRIVDHWLAGWGSHHDETRVDALKLVQVSDSLEEAKAKMQARTGKEPVVLATVAQERGRVLSVAEARGLLEDSRPVLLLFGTAWGLAREIVEQADYVLPPVQKHAPYNHLSVRTAAAIIVDRVLGDRGQGGMLWT